jgi:hypothetical protein
MTRREVQSLQDIARANGGSLSINPETGLVEAGFLQNLLPMIAGIGLTAATGGMAAPWMIGLGVGGIQAARTGSLEKGLMAGLGAYGGAGLGSALTASAATTGTPITGQAASKLASTDMALGGQGGSAAASQYLPSAPGAMSGLDKLKYGVQGLGTEAGRSAALGSLGGGMAAAKTAGMALAPVLTDTGDQKAPPSDNEQYNFEYDPGRVENPDEGYTGAFTGERTHFRPSYTRLPNTRVTGMRDGGDVKRYAGQTGSVVTDDKDKVVGIQGAAAAKNYVPFEYPAVAAQPVGNVQPVAANPFYTMTGQSADAYKYLMGLGPQTKGPTVVKPPVITDAPVTTERPVVTTRPVVTLGPVITTPFETFTEEEYSTSELTTFEDDTTEEETTEEEYSTSELTTFEDDTTEEETTTEEEYSTSELTTFEDDTTEEETTTEEEYTTEETTSLSIYEKPIVSSIPDDLDVTIEDFTFPDLTVEEVTVDKTDKSFWDDPDLVDVGPSRGLIKNQEELDESFDEYLSGGGNNGFDLGGSFDFRGGDYGGGGKYFDDQGMATMAMANGGMTPPMIRGLSDLGGYSDGGRLLRGPGDGVSDSIPATIGGKQPARLADGEFVIPARIVSELGNGSTEAGARKLYAMMERIQAGRRKTIGKNRVAANSRADRHLPV